MNTNRCTTDRPLAAGFPKGASTPAGWRRVIVLMGLAAAWYAALVAPAWAENSPPSDIGDRAASVAAVSASFRIDPQRRSGTLRVEAEIQEGYHIYAMTQPPPFIASRIRLDPSSRIEVHQPPKESGPPKVRVHQTLGVELHEHEGRVAWSLPFRIVADAAVDDLTISGHLYAQACNADGCLPPTKYPFTARLDTSDQAVPQSAGFVGESIVGPAAAGGSAVSLDFGKLRSSGGVGTPPLIVVLATAFLAGLLLNFMPCVLPVIGLKIMAFAEQSGQSRAQALLLNLWYSLGLLSVFLVLATLSVFLGLGWGEQFSSVAFNVVLASVVFAFALSFLGVWEVPIPGFVGSGRAVDLAQKEGAAGAFSKGVLTTVLATPCSGPLLGSALAWAIAQPPAITYAGFASVGLGMASPYLLIGAFPRLIAFLPKPGAWMITFKQIMGFVLLGAVVFVLTFVPIAFVVPTLAFMVGLWAACWWIGRTAPTKPVSKKLRAWIAAGAFAALAGLISFGPLHRVMDARFRRAVDRELAARGTQATTADADRGSELPWQPFSRELLEDLAARQKTVLVDFTADWCLTCKANEAVAINTASTRRLVRANDVVTLKADKTQPAPEVDAMLRLLGNSSGAIPFYAIFPAGNPNQPILLDGLLTSPEPIVDALRRAGPSKDIHRRVAAR